MTWGFVGTLALSAAVVGGVALVLYVARRVIRDEEAAKREAREVELVGMRRVGLNRDAHEVDLWV